MDDSSRLMASPGGPTPRPDDGVPAGAKPETNDQPTLVPLTPRGRRLNDERFRPRIERLRRTIYQTPLTILVWGPGENFARESKFGEALYSKRVQIVNHLRPGDHNAQFSEDLVGSEDWRTEQLMQALEAELVILLAGSPATFAEFGDFCQHKEIAPKMLVFFEEKNRSTYLGDTARYSRLDPRHVDFFRYPDDLDRCHLLTKVGQIVKHHQVAKWKRRNGMP